MFFVTHSTAPNRIEILKTREKVFDANLALHALDDACADAYDCAVIISSDSDFATELQ